MDFGSAGEVPVNEVAVDEELDMELDSDRDVEVVGYGDGRGQTATMAEGLRGGKFSTHTPFYRTSSLTSVPFLIQ